MEVHEANASWAQPIILTENSICYKKIEQTSGENMEFETTRASSHLGKTYVYCKIPGSVAARE